jgi:hypothetical protein
MVASSSTALTAHRPRHFRQAPFDRQMPGGSEHNCEMQHLRTRWIFVEVHGRAAGEREAVAEVRVLREHAPGAAEHPELCGVVTCIYFDAVVRELPTVPVSVTGSGRPSL